MAELVDIRRVEIGPKNLTARVHFAEEAPLMTSEDLEGTARVYRLLPHLADHACIGDAGTTFRDAMGDTELAHLLEHVTVELLAQTDLAGDTPAGRTWTNEVEDRTYEIELACPDDVLVAAALSCGVWILDWAYSGGEDPEPDVKAIVGGLVNLVDSVEGQGEDLVVDVMPELDEPEDDELDDEVDDDRDDETEDEQEELVAASTTIVEPAPVVEAPAPVEPVATPRPLWTPAPEVPASATRVHREAETRSPEVEAEIDEIMATIEMPVLDLGTTSASSDDID